MGRQVCSIYSKIGDYFMIFEKTKLGDVFVITPEKKEDNRGFFARIFDKKSFEEKGLNCDLKQFNISFNTKKGTIRGVHFQKKPFQETKYVRCVKGRIFVVIIDLRKESNTFLDRIELELNSTLYNMLYIPEGMGMGIQTLEDNSELFYQMTQVYAPDFSSGIPWNDPFFNIKWPLKVSEISEKDKTWNMFDTKRFSLEKE